MTIKGVGNGQSPYGRIKIQQEAERLEENSRAAKKPAVQRDEVVVSEDARLMNAAMDAIRNTPETRADKVARLKAMVQAGSYSVDGQNIAARMLAEDQELLG
jgi:negative regulator of flagellin synthesis FlgM